MMIIISKLFNRNRIKFIYVSFSMNLYNLKIFFLNLDKFMKKVTYNIKLEGLSLKNKYFLNF